MKVKNKDAGLDKIIAAHQAAKAKRLRMEAKNVPDGRKYDAAVLAEEEALLIIINFFCRTDAGNKKKLRYVFENDVHEACGEPEEILGIGDDFAPTVLAVRAFLEQRA